MPDQLTRDDLAAMSSHDIAQALRDGQLTDMLAGNPNADLDPVAPEDMTAHERMRAMSSSELVDAWANTDLKAQLIAERAAGIR